jgi:PAS domain S-box-containing protein
MLEAVLDALLRRLGCRAGEVWSAPGAHAAARRVAARRRGETVGAVAEAPFDASAGCLSGVHVRADGARDHVFELPGFGALVLERSEALSPRELEALAPHLPGLAAVARSREEHAALAELVASLPDVVFRCRLDARGALSFEHVSPRCRDVLGLEAEVLIADPGTFLAALVGEDRRELIAALASAAELRTGVEQLVRQRDAAGRERWLSFSASPSREGEHWSGLLRDVTAREQRAAAERDAAVLRTSALLAAVDDAVIGADAGGRITHWNQGAERMLGRATSAMLGAPLTRIMPERMVAAHQRGMAHHLATGRSNLVGRPVEVPALHADGHELMVELVLSRVEDGGEVFFIGVMRDLTERHRARFEEARTLEQERRLARVLVELGGDSFQSLPDFERRLTSSVARALGVARASLWSIEGSAIVCRDLCEAELDRHSTGLVLREDDFPPYFEALRRETGILAADAATHEATACFRGSYLEPLGIVSMLDIPLRNLEGAIGVLCVEATERRDWSAAEVRFCQDAAALYVKAMDRHAWSEREARHAREEEAARRAIEEQNRRLRSLSEAIPDLLFTVTVDGHITYEQRGAGPDLLLDPSEIPGQTVQGLFSAEVAASILAAVEAAVRSGQVQAVEYTLELPQGAQVFEARISRLGEREAFALVRNVTPERQRVEAIQQQRERLEALLSSTSAILYTSRFPDFRVDYVSESAMSVLGFSVATLSAPGFWERALHPEDRARVISGLGELVARGHHTHEYRHLHADGTYRWLRDQVRLVPDAEGRWVRAVGASFDITDRKRSEQRLGVLLALQEMFARVSEAFLKSPSEIAAGVVDEALAALGRIMQPDRAYVFFFERGLASNTHEWCAEGVAPQKDLLQGIPVEGFGFFLRPIEGGQHLHIPSVSSLGPEADGERQLLSAQGIESLLAVPLMLEGSLRGFVGLDNPRIEPLSVEELARLVRVLADAIAAGLHRVENERALRELNARLVRQAEQQRGMLELSNELARASSRQELFARLRGSLCALLGIERACIVERIEAERVRVLGLDSGTCGSSNDVPDEFLLDASELEGTACELVIQRGQGVSTPELDRERFLAWRILGASRARYLHFVSLPLLGARGVLGALDLGLTRLEPPSASELDWFSQLGAMLSAYLSALDAREALLGWSATLESRVEERTRELRASEMRFAELFEHAPQAMLIVAAGEVVSSNLKARRLFGRDPAELRGTLLAALVPEEHRTRHGLLAAQFESSPRARSMATDRVVTALRGDGSTFLAEIGLVPIELNDKPHVLAGVTDVSARHEAQEAVARSLLEKETLLKEIHHRVKNNLQIVSSLLTLQAGQIASEDARVALEESVFRVRSMALIHEQLYGVESLHQIDFGDYARALAQSLQSALAPRARLAFALEPVTLAVDLAVPLGLIVNELVTNAFKYGLKRDPEAPAPGRTGADCDVRVEIGAVEGRVRVAVIDAGCGLPEGFDPLRPKSLGLRLVSTLTRQVRGELSVDVDRGTRFVVTCPGAAVGRP